MLSPEELQTHLLKGVSGLELNESDKFDFLPDKFMMDKLRLKSCSKLIFNGSMISRLPGELDEKLALLLPDTEIEFNSHCSWRNQGSVQVIDPAP